MRFAEIAAAALTLAGTTLAAQPVAKVSLSAHDVCQEGQLPNQEFKTEPIDEISVTKDSCTKMKLDHTKDLQVISYSAEIKTVTHPSSLVCEGVGIYANEYCQGEADEVVAWEYDEVTTQSKCFKSLPFHDTKYISMKLFCQEDPAGYDGDDDAETVAELAKQKAAAAAGGQS